VEAVIPFLVSYSYTNETNELVHCNGRAAGSQISIFVQNGIACAMWHSSFSHFVCSPLGLPLEHMQCSSHCELLLVFPSMSCYPVIVTIPWNT
jgi:hypothetical protein